MKIKIVASILVTVILFGGTVFPQERGVEIKVKKADGKVQDVRLYSGSYALIIGNSDYSNGWDRLSGVVSDVVAVRNILQRHGFVVETEENLTSEKFEARIRKFINDYGYDRDNRLIIYYAGHGYTLNSAGDKRELGYIIPSDTPLPTKDERGFRQKAVSMIAIQSFARQIQAKHALFVFDSCFSGKLFALRNTLKVTPFIYEKVDSPVRQFITAGNETQTVPDESIFRKSFVRGLEGEADRNDDTFITGTELADYLKEKVTNYSERRQTPQYGLINDIDLDRGDFVFVLKEISKVSKNKEIVSPPPPPPSSTLGFDTYDEPFSASTKTWKAEINSFSFEITKCTRLGKTVFCDIMIVNNEKDSKIKVHANYYNALFGMKFSRAIDEFGNEYKAVGIGLGQNSDNGLVNGNLVKGIGLKFRLKFENISNETSKFSLLEISFETEKFLKATVRNIILTN